MEADQRQGSSAEPNFPPSKVRLIPWPSYKGLFMTIMVGRVTYGALQYDNPTKSWYINKHASFRALSEPDQDVINGVIKEYQDMCAVTRRLFS